MALVEDPKFKVWVEKYAADQELFFKDFALAFAKLIGELLSSSGLVAYEQNSV
jgi:catalase (peroxidase I)